MRQSFLGRTIVHAGRRDLPYTTRDRPRPIDPSTMLFLCHDENIKLLVEYNDYYYYCLLVFFVI